MGWILARNVTSQESTKKNFDNWTNAKTFLINKFGQICFSLLLLQMRWVSSWTGAISLLKKGLIDNFKKYIPWNNSEIVWSLILSCFALRGKWELPFSKHNGSFNNYVDMILPFFDHLPTSPWIFFYPKYGTKMDIFWPYTHLILST